MNVKVNRTVFEIPEGTNVRQVILDYLTRRNVSKSRLERARVSDAFGQDLDLDAPLSDGDVIKCII